MGSRYGDPSRFIDDEAQDADDVEEELDRGGNRQANISAFFASEPQFSAASPATLGDDDVDVLSMDNDTGSTQAQDLRESIEIDSDAAISDSDSSEEEQHASASTWQAVLVQNKLRPLESSILKLSPGERCPAATFAGAENVLDWSKHVALVLPRPVNFDVDDADPQSTISWKNKEEQLEFGSAVWEPNLMRQLLVLTAENDRAPALEVRVKKTETKAPCWAYARLYFKNKKVDLNDEEFISAVSRQLCLAVTSTVRASTSELRLDRAHVGAAGSHFRVHTVHHEEAEYCVVFPRILVRRDGIIDGNISFSENCATMISRWTGIDREANAELRALGDVCVPRVHPFCWVDYPGYLTWVVRDSVVIETEGIYGLATARGQAALAPLMRAIVDVQDPSEWSEREVCLVLNRLTPDTPTNCWRVWGRKLLALPAEGFDQAAKDIAAIAQRVLDSTAKLEEINMSNQTCVSGALLRDTWVDIGLVPFPVTHDPVLLNIPVAWGDSGASNYRIGLAPAGLAIDDIVLPAATFSTTQRDNYLQWMHEWRQPGDACMSRYKNAVFTRIEGNYVVNTAKRLAAVIGKDDDPVMLAQLTQDVLSIWIVATDRGFVLAQAKEPGCAPWLPGVLFEIKAVSNLNEFTLRQNVIQLPVAPEDRYNADGSENKRSKPRSVSFERILTGQVLGAGIRQYRQVSVRNEDWDKQLRLGFVNLSPTPIDITSSDMFANGIQRTNSSIYASLDQVGYSEAALQAAYDVMEVLREMFCKRDGKYTPEWDHDSANEQVLSVLRWLVESQYGDDPCRTLMVLYSTEGGGMKSWFINYFLKIFGHITVVVFAASMQKTQFALPQGHQGLAQFYEDASNMRLLSKVQQASVSIENPKGGTPYQTSFQPSVASSSNNLDDLIQVGKTDQVAGYRRLYVAEVLSKSSPKIYKERDEVLRRSNMLGLRTLIDFLRQQRGSEKCDPPGPNIPVLWRCGNIGWPDKGLHRSGKLWGVPRLALVHFISGYCFGLENARYFKFLQKLSFCGADYLPDSRAAYDYMPYRVPVVFLRHLWMHWKMPFVKNMPYGQPDEKSSEYKVKMQAFEEFLTELTNYCGAKLVTLEIPNDAFTVERLAVRRIAGTVDTAWSERSAVRQKLYDLVAVLPSLCGEGNASLGGVTMQVIQLPPAYEMAMKVPPIPGFHVFDKHRTVRFDDEYESLFYDETTGVPEIKDYPRLKGHHLGFLAMKRAAEAAAAAVAAPASAAAAAVPPSPRRLIGRTRTASVAELDQSARLGQRSRLTDLLDSL